MKIIHILRNLEIGGLERMVTALAAQQHQDGHSVSIVEIIKASTMCVNVDSAVNVMRSAGYPRAVSPQTLLRLVLTFRRLRPDIVHVHNTLALHHVWLASFFCPIKIVFTKHGMNFVSGGYRHLYRRPDAVACVSRGVKSRYAKLFPGMQQKLYDAVNGVGCSHENHACGSVNAGTTSGDRTNFQDDAVFLSSSQTVRFVWCGRMSEEKNLPLLIETCRRVQQVHPRIQLILLGDGPLHSDIPAHDWIKTPGMVTEVRSYLQAADCFVLVSQTEGLPMALLEAGMCGLPAIVSRVGEMPDIVMTAGGGWVVEPGNVDDLSTTIETVASVSKRALRESGQKLQRYICEHYSLEKMAADYEMIYQGIL